MLLISVVATGTASPVVTPSPEPEGSGLDDSDPVFRHPSARLVAIAVPVSIVGALAIILLGWCSWRRRRKALPRVPNGWDPTIRPYVYGRTPGPPVTPVIRSTAVVGRPRDRIDVDVEPYRLHANRSRAPETPKQRMVKGLFALRPPQQTADADGDGSVSEGARSMSDDRSQWTAIRRALRHAGFTAHALLSSLNRIPHPASENGAGSEVSPPRYEDA